MGRGVWRHSCDSQAQYYPYQRFIVETLLETLVERENRKRERERESTKEADAVRSTTEILDAGGDREIGPVLFILLFATDHLLALSSTTRTLGNCHVSYTLNNQLVKLITFRPLIQPALIQVRQSLRSLLAPVAEHDRTFGWIRPKR